MSTHQRKHGQPALVYKRKLVTDKRGNEQYQVDMEDPYEVSAVFVWDRGNRAELPGQQTVDVYRMLVEADLPDVELFSAVKWRGFMWDVIASPFYRHGTRQVRHWTIMIRRRPHQDG